jgi:hypothetical protein
MEKLVVEEAAQRNLAKAQLDSLLIKKKQIEIMTEKLRQLEKENENLSSAPVETSDVDFTIVTDAAKAAEVSTITQYNSVVVKEMTIHKTVQDQNTVTLQDQNTITLEGEAMMDMLADPVFQEKIMKLREQEFELKYLEEQLASLKQIKQQLADKHHLIATSATASGITVTPLDGQMRALTSVDAKASDETEELKAEHKELLSSLELMSAELDKLELKQKTIMSQAHAPDIVEKVSKEEIQEADAESVNELMNRLMNASVDELEKGFAVIPEVNLPIQTDEVSCDKDETTAWEAVAEGTQMELDQEAEKELDKDAEHALEEEDDVDISPMSVEETGTKINEAKEVCETYIDPTFAA